MFRVVFVGRHMYARHTTCTFAFLFVCQSVFLSGGLDRPEAKYGSFFEAGLGLNRRDTETRSIIPKCRSYDDV